MPRKALPPLCNDKDRQTLKEWAVSRSMEARLVDRARMICKLLDGESVTKVAIVLKVRPNTIIDWRNRSAEGVPGLLYDRQRCGKPPKYNEEFRERVLKTLEQPPPPGQSCWDGPAVAKCLGASDDEVWRVLRKQNICLARQRSWCVSTDPEFAPKAADIVGLYLAPPEKVLVISVNEKTSIQALERTTGYVCTSSGKVVRGLKSTYKRHGTLNLFAALNMATGAIHTQTTELKRRVEFLAFMDQVLLELPGSNKRSM